MFQFIQQSCVVAFGIGLLACSYETITEPLPSPVACYTLSLGAWNTALPEPLPPPPNALQLTDSLGTQVLENGRRVVRNMPAGSTKSYPFQYWVPREQGDLLLVFSNGFTGMTIDLTPTGANFSGTARGFFDFGSFDVTAPVQMQRTAC
jgi:hypothetical protein